MELSILMTFFKEGSGGHILTWHEALFARDLLPTTLRVETRGSSGIGA